MSTVLCESRRIYAARFGENSGAHAGLEPLFGGQIDAPPKELRQSGFNAEVIPAVHDAREELNHNVDVGFRPHIARAAEPNRDSS